MFKVYVYINDFNKLVYVGQTCKSLDKRAGKDGNDYKHCKLFYNAINKYGWCNFTSVILKDNLTHGEADIWEKHYMEVFQSTNRNLGYNIREAGGSRGKHSESTKLLCRLAKLGKSFSAEHRANIAKSRAILGNKPHLGHPHSMETKAKLSASLKGKTWKLVDGKRVWTLTNNLIISGA